MRKTLFVAAAWAVFAVPGLSGAQTINPGTPVNGATLGANTFTGEQTLPAATTAGAPLNIPQGAAPTSPNNGDIWTTSAGVYAQIGGVTVGPFGAGGGGGVPANLTLTNPSSAATFTLLGGKTFTVDNTLTLSGTDATTMTFPSTSATVARSDAAQTFTGTQTFSNTITANGAIAQASGQFLVLNSVDVVKSTPPTLGTGCGTGATINGVSSLGFQVQIGTSPSTACAVTMPWIASSGNHGYACHAEDITTPAEVVAQTGPAGGGSNSTVTFSFYARGSNTLTAPTANDYIYASCVGF